MHRLVLDLMSLEVANKANSGMKSSLTRKAHMGGDGFLDGYSSSFASFPFLFKGNSPVSFSRLRSVLMRLRHVERSIQYPIQCCLLEKLLFVFLCQF